MSKSFRYDLMKLAYDNYTKKQFMEVCDLFFRRWK